MQNHENLKGRQNDDSSRVAELWDCSHVSVFRFILKGYERAEDPDDWLSVDIEYASKGVNWRCANWETNTLAMARSLKDIRKFQGVTSEPQEIFHGYHDGLSIIYKKPHVRLVKWAQVFRRRSGHFVQGRFDSVSSGLAFEFKVSRQELLRFQKQLAEACRQFPIRSPRLQTILSLNE